MQPAASLGFPTLLKEKPDVQFELQPLDLSPNYTFVRMH